MLNQREINNVITLYKKATGEQNVDRNTVIRGTPIHKLAVVGGGYQRIVDWCNSVIRKKEAENRFIYTWGMFDQDVSELVEKIQKLDRPLTNIYGLPRGGLCLAVALSHRLNLPLIVNPLKITQKTLIVDDIADTGKALEQLGNSLAEPIQEYFTATLWYHKQSKVVPTFWVREKQQDWLIFPWETINSTK